MVELDGFKTTLNNYETPLKEIKDSLDLDNKKKRIEEIEANMEEPGFWDDMDKSQNSMKELKALKSSFEDFNAVMSLYEDAKTLIELGYEENDPEIIPEVDEMVAEFVKAFDKMRIQTLLSEEYDKNNAILRLNAGAGGTESCDWASMLLRMYTRWAEQKGFTTEILDYLDGEISLEEATYRIKRDTRHFAKRQLTWFGREKEVIFVNKNEFNYQKEAILDYMKNILKEKEIIKEQ